MGKRLGGALLPFDAMGRLLTGASAHPIGWSAAAVVLGVVVHVIAATFWAFVCARLVLRWRGHLYLAALATTAAWFSASWVVGRITGRGLATLLPVGDHIVLALVFAVSLVMGMRFALFDSRRT
jgi:uncharacterized protein YebE (UPF0316 family)